MLGHRVQLPLNPGDVLEPGKAIDTGMGLKTLTNMVGTLQGRVHGGTRQMMPSITETQPTKIIGATDSTFKVLGVEHYVVEI